jgi:hypothetical protein
VIVSRAEELGEVIKSGGETTQAAQDGHDSHDDRKDFLNPGKVEAALNLDLTAIPEQAVFAIDAKTSKLLH